jgi:putative ABC transport system permease protein
MRLSHISLGNLRRRKGKTLLLAAGLTIGVAMVVALLGITFQMRQEVGRNLDEYGANIVVTPGGEDLSLSYGGMDVASASYDVRELRDSDMDVIRGIGLGKNIRAVAPKVIGAYRAGGRPVMVVGVDFPAEFRIKNWWRLKGVEPLATGLYEPPVAAPTDIVLGHSVAVAMGAGVGGKVVLGPREYTVRGVLEENASQDDMAVFMDMGEAQRLLGKQGVVSMIEVSALCSDCPIGEIVAQIAAGLPHARVSAVRQAVTLKMQTVEQVAGFSMAVSVAVLAIGALSVFVSMLASVNERTREIGVLRAIGFRKSQVIRIILAEAFLISLLSGVSGWALGSLLSVLLAPRLGVELSFDPAVLAPASAVALVVGMLGSLYPALKASRLEPLEALRHI